MVLPEGSGVTRVMVMGDSFVWGAYLEAEETLPSLLQARLSDAYEVFNLGVPGWGIDQMYLAYQHYKDVIDPDFVILAFIDDDVMRALEAYRDVERLSKPSFYLHDGELVLRKPTSKRELYFSRLVGNSVLLSRVVLRHIYLVGDAKPVINQMLIELERDVRSRGSRLVVVRIPTPDQDTIAGIVRRRLVDIATMLEGTAATYLEPVEQMATIPNWKVDLYRKNDSHLNALGNQVLADYLIARVFEN